MKLTLLSLGCVLFGFACTDEAPAQGEDEGESEGEDEAEAESESEAEGECGDGACLGSEDCGDCESDCPCSEGTTCQDGECVEVCGNDLCAGGENCDTCPMDCVCPSGTVCLEGTCSPTCGNAECDAGENCENCATDCACANGSDCTGGVCVEACGNALCDAGEHCGTCPADCGCPEGTECIYDEISDNGTCIPTCGDGDCDDIGETCNTCVLDCACALGAYCLEDGRCVGSSTTCDEGECGGSGGSCKCDETCIADNTCCENACDFCGLSSCPGDIGDGICTVGLEDCTTSPDDCASDEVCDLIDNDCDGDVDDGTLAWDFVDTDGWALVPNAHRATDDTMVLAESTNQRGAMWYVDPLNITRFHVSLRFRMCGAGGEEEYTGSDGFAFVIQTNGASTTTIGGNNEGLGYTGLSGLAMEFDIHDNAEGALNSIAVVRPTDNSPYARDITVTCLECNDWKTADIEFEADEESGDATTTITVENLITSSVTATVPDFSIREYWFGFTGATGGEGCTIQIDDVTLEAEGAACLP